MNEGKLQELLADEAFLKKIFAMETPQQVQAAFHDEGVELKEEDILALRNSAEKAASGEMPVSELDEVAGGQKIDFHVMPAIQIPKQETYPPTFSRRW